MDKIVSFILSGNFCSQVSISMSGICRGQNCHFQHVWNLLWHLQFVLVRERRRRSAAVALADVDGLGPCRPAGVAAALGVSRGRREVPQLARVGPSCLGLVGGHLARLVEPLRPAARDVVLHPLAYRPFLFSLFGARMRVSSVCSVTTSATRSPVSSGGGGG
jgi:hypothetical protein